MEIKKEVFRAYDIRGWYGKDIDEDFAYAFGRALVRFLREEKKLAVNAIVVNKDARSVSEKLYPRFIDGMIDEGVTVFDGGVSTTPMHYFSIGTYDVQAGVMVTPSHGAPGMCGFKISTKTERISEETGILEIYAMMRQPLPSVTKKGVVHPFDALEQYVHFLKTHIHIPMIGPKLHIAIDAAGGAAGKVLKKLLPDMRIEHTDLFFDADPEFATHDPNPLLPQSQAFVRQEIKKSIQDFGVLFDGDGDRVLFFDESGEEASIDYVAALIAREKLQSRPYATVLLDVNASRRSVEYIEDKKGVVKRIRVGTAFFRNELQRDPSIIMGAESSGHFYYPEFFNSDAAMLTFIYLLNIRAFAQRPLSELIAPMRTVARSGEINFMISDKDRMLEKVKQYFFDGKLSTIDGIAIEYPEWRFTLRPSNTDPVTRMHIEANTKKLLEEKRKVLEGLIHD